MGPLHRNWERQGQDREIGKNKRLLDVQWNDSWRDGTGEPSRQIGNKVTWMRLCAMCKKLMLKPDVSHSVHSKCGGHLRDRGAGSSDDKAS
jgi:hypothetical protein